MVLALLMALVGSPAIAGDAPEISRSQGEEGGVVVLWPRVIPSNGSKTAQAAAWVVQQSMKRLAAETLPGRPIDVRPEPERVCPMAGCKGVVLGAVVVHNGDACIAVATVSGPGQSAQTLVPWAGQVDLKQLTVPFREPPESYLTIRDFAKCHMLTTPLAEGETPVRNALAAQAGVPAPVSPTPPPPPATTPPTTVVPTPAPTPQAPAPQPKPESEPVEGW